MPCYYQSDKNFNVFFWTSLVTILVISTTNYLKLSRSFTKISVITAEQIIACSRKSTRFPIKHPCFTMRNGFDLQTIDLFRRRTNFQFGKWSNLTGLDWWIKGSTDEILFHLSSQSFVLTSKSAQLSCFSKGIPLQESESFCFVHRSWFFRNVLIREFIVSLP